MKIAAHVLAYNVSRFIKPVLENLEPHVDKIYVAHAQRPFGYNEKARNSKVNPTTIEEIRTASGSNKIEIISGDWATEEDMRNACLTKARSEGFDWFLIQDADELYPEASWNKIMRVLLQNKSDDHFTTTWYNFWKSSQFVLTDMHGSIKGVNAGFAVRCSSGIKFTDRRLCNNQHVKTIDYPSYHYSYVMSDEEMLEKLATWSHSHELFSNYWYRYKWLNWDESTRWLNPVHPYFFYKAVRFPLDQPDFGEQFDLPVNIYANQRKPTFGDIVGEALFDTAVRLTLGKRSLKRVAKAILKK